MAFAPLSPELKEKALSIASSFASGGMVAKFQVGGDVDPDDADSMDSGYDMSPSVSETAAMEDIGTKDVDRGPDDEDRGDDSAAATAAVPEDTGGDDRVVSETVLGRDTPTASETIMEARGKVDPAIQEAVKAQAAAQAAQAALAAEEKDRESVTEKALTTSPVDFVMTEGYDMAGPAPAPADFDEGDLGPVSADIGSLAKELGVDLKDVDLAQPGIGGLLAPLGVAKAIKDEFTGVGALRDAAAGGEVVRNEKGEVVGIVSRNEAGQVTEISPTGIAAAFDPALRGAYRELSVTEQEEREARDRGGDEPITEEEVAVEEEMVPEKPPTIDIVPFRPQDFYYFYPQQRYGLPSMMNMRTQ